MLEWIKNHVEWIATTLGAGVVTAATMWIDFGRRLSRLEDRHEALTRKVDTQVDSMDDFTERFLKVEGDVRRALVDIRDQRELLERVEQSTHALREATQREREALLNAIERLNDTFVSSLAELRLALRESKE